MDLYLNFHHCLSFLTICFTVQIICRVCAPLCRVLTSYVYICSTVHTQVVSCLQPYLTYPVFATHSVVFSLLLYFSLTLFLCTPVSLSSLSFSALTAWPFVKLSACENVPKVMAGGVYKTLRAISFIESTQPSTMRATRHELYRQTTLTIHIVRTVWH